MMTETKSVIARAPVRRVPRLVVWLVLLCTGVAIADEDWGAYLAHGYRGNRTRKEGLVAEPKSDYAVALVSARVDLKRRESYAEWPDALKVRFYLPQGENATQLHVRQISSPRGFYLLDSVTSAWTPARVNEFSWPPREVMAQVYAFQFPADASVTMTKDTWLARLGVLVRLGETGPVVSGQRVTVAPAALVHSSQAFDVPGYTFTFTTNGPARIKSQILSPAKAVVYADEREAFSGGPLTLSWDASRQTEGWYELLLDPAFDDGSRPQMAVRFFHKSSLAGSP